jgi:hypothetical protein
MNYRIHGHRQGDKLVPSSTLKDIREALIKTGLPVKRGNSREIKSQVLELLRQCGWSGEISLSPHSGITVTSQKGDVGLCIQTGNMGRMYADLLKLQTLYTGGSIKTAILVVPTYLAAKALGDNLANFERLTREMAIFEPVITVPLAIVGME